MNAFNNRFGNAGVGKTLINGKVKSFFTANSNFMSKSIQKNFRFDLSFDLEFEKELQKYFIQIYPYHILSIDAPTSYNFKYESMKIGPYSYSFPTMNHDGFDITVVFEEDNISSIGKFIHVLQSKIIRDTDSGANGNYNPQSKNRIAVMTINIYDDIGEIVRSLEYLDVFFTGATPTILNYDGNESIKYTITFHCDFFQQTFNKIQD